ncbi:ferritin-like domain-containing protein [Klebsiella pneumoniae]|nr:ferritin-like domain-containing protein [Klebsiella pneumoniae]
MNPRPEAHRALAYLPAPELEDALHRVLVEAQQVRIGNRWYRHLCRARGLDPVALYPSLVEQFEAPRLRPPFNVQARSEAGFSDEEIAYLSS